MTSAVKFKNSMTSVWQFKNQWYLHDNSKTNDKCMEIKKNNDIFMTISIIHDIWKTWYIFENQSITSEWQLQKQWHMHDNTIINDICTTT